MQQVKIFVSYSHVDFEPYPGFKDSRVGTMLAEIEHGLRCHDRRGKFALLRDVKGMLNVSDVIDEKIDEAINDCDIGLILLSRSYTDSESCRYEIRKLLEAHKRLAIVETECVWDGDLNSDFAVLRPQLEGILSAQFYNGTRGHWRLFGDPLPQLMMPDQRREYNDAIRRVIEGVETAAAEILSTRKTTGAAADDSGTHTVFLACPTSDVRNEASTLAAALDKAGYSTLAFSPALYASPGASVADMVKSAIDKCDVVIQLIGGLPGSRFEGKAVVPLQYELAKASGKPLHVWRSPDFDPGECDDEYRKFLDGLNAHEMSYEDFERYALKQVANTIEAAKLELQKKSAVDKAVTAGENIVPNVAIDFARPDSAIADVVMNALQTRTNVSPLPFELNHDQFKEYVSLSDGIVLVFAESRDGQLRNNAHFGLLQRIKRDRPTFDINVAIGNGVPSTPGAPALHPRGPNVYVIKIDPQNMQVDPGALEQFIQGVRANAVRTLQ